MSTTVVPMPVMNEPMSLDMKTELKPEILTSLPITQETKNQHPLHQFDLTQMSQFYSACVGKLKETTGFEPTLWAEKKQGLMKKNH